MILAVAAHYAGLNPMLKWDAMRSVFFYYANYHMIYADASNRGVADLGATWSLAVEEHFYLLFPLIYIALLRCSRKAQVSLLAALCTISLIWRSILSYGLHVSTDRTYMATDTRFDSILLGCLLAVGISPLYEKLPQWFNRNPRCWALIGVLLLGVDHIPVVRSAISFSLIGLALFPIFWFAIGHSKDAWCLWLNHPALRLIGRWSYTLYLIHALVIDIVAELFHLSPTLSSILAIIPCALGAWATEKYIEIPSRSLRDRILLGMSKREVAHA
jgi:peptidoglycan/LPS O-acetylase OafA/YrhL